MKTIKKTILSFTLVFFMMILPVGDSAGMVTAQAQTMVYVTPTGSKYHTHKCGRGNFYQTTLPNALARGLTPCKKCFGSSGGYSQTRKSSTTTTKKTTIPAPPFTVSFLLCPFTSTIFVLLIDSGLIFGLVSPPEKWSQKEKARQPLR